MNRKGDPRSKEILAFVTNSSLLNLGNFNKCQELVPPGSTIAILNSMAFQKELSFGKNELQKMHFSIAQEVLSTLKLLGVTGVQDA